MRYLIFLAILVSNSLYAVSSREERAARHYIILAEPFGLNYHLTQSLRFGYIANEMMIFEGSAFHSSSCLDDVCAMKKSGGEFRVQRFLGNSFYVTAIAGYTKQSFLPNVHYFYEGADEKDHSYQFQNSKLSALVGLGHQWQFSGFSLGVQWAAFGINAYTQTKVSHSQCDGSSTINCNKEKERIASHMEVPFEMQLLRLVVGVAF